MINVTREVNSPASLNTPIIRQYISDLHAHLEDPNNVAKPEPTAEYRTSDLLEAFDRCFYQKCYLTEQSFPNSYCMDVEHFVAQSEDPARIYEWTNLYPADHKFNRMKPRKTPEGGYLDPCADEDDVEAQIFYSLGLLGSDPSFEASDPSNIKAVNTSRLLNRLHNGHNDETKKATADLRAAIAKKYDQINLLIMEWLNEPPGTQLKREYGNQLKLHLSRKASFTMLIRSTIPVLRFVPKDFLD